MNRLLILVCALSASACQHLAERLPIPIATVSAAMETAPMLGRGDKADDPAIWIHPTSAAQSLILGTNKDAGLYVYDLSGNERQRLLVGQVNNVDIRGEIAVASNDEINGLSWFHIDSGSQQVSHLGNSQIERVEPYGLCAGLVNGTFYVAVTFKDGLVELYAADLSTAVPSTTLLRKVPLASQLEGCVFDDQNARLFIGEEAHGVWVLDFLSDTSVPVEVDAISNGNGLVADVEGLSLYLGNDGGGYLIVSAQEADRFVIYNRLPPYELAGIVKIEASSSIDAVTHTDGLDASSAALPGYPHGVLVVQDDGNPLSGVNQNFKLVDWRQIEKALTRN